MRRTEGGVLIGWLVGWSKMMMIVREGQRRRREGGRDRRENMKGAKQENLGKAGIRVGRSVLLIQSRHVIYMASQQSR